MQLSSAADQQSKTTFGKSTSRSLALRECMTTSDRFTALGSDVIESFDGNVA